MNFWREPWTFRWGERGGEFHDAMIEERRAHFDGVRHAHAVDFGEDVAGKIIFLIEPEKRREWVC